jgi:hypothetical protein
MHLKLKNNNANNANNANIHPLSIKGRLETHIPEKVVHQMDNILIQDIDLPCGAALGRNSAVFNVTDQSQLTNILHATHYRLTCRTDHSSVHQAPFCLWGAILAGQSTSQPTA